MLEQLNHELYNLTQWSNNLVLSQLDHLSFFSLFLIFLTGLLTSLTPCMLSMLPITIGYIGGYETRNKLSGLIQSSTFSLGLATTLTALGIVAASLGKVYGQIGLGLPIIVSVIAIIMGLNLLELIPITFPSFTGTDWLQGNFPPLVKAYLFGLTFGLIASPCSTPVLASLLAYIIATQNLLLGAGLLLAYTLGYVSPLIIAGTFTTVLKKLLELRRWSSWINPISGVLLLAFGLYSLLSRLPIFY